MESALQEAFFNVLLPHSGNSERLAGLWQAIAKQCSAPGRYYHNVQHLEQLYSALNTVRASIHHWEALVLASFYHDYIYNPGRPDNEERSAAHAREVLSGLTLPDTLIRLVRHHIRATKRHRWSSEEDTNYFTDADLWILGAPPKAYRAYTLAIRKELALYSDAAYRKGGCGW